MLKTENIDVYGFEAAIRGMRNPMNSWDRSDSHACNPCVGSDDCDRCEFHDTECGYYYVGPNDLRLMRSLYKAGTEHRKYLRMINVSMDIVAAPAFWWPEFDSYKVGTVRNSCSKMHKIHVKPFEYTDFSHEGIDEVGGLAKTVFERYLTTLEDLRQAFNATHERKYWRALIEMLPQGHQLRATVQINYEVAVNIIRQRTGHKLTEWRTMVDELMKLPYLKAIIGEEEPQNES